MRRGEESIERGRGEPHELRSYAKKSRFLLSFYFIFLFFEGEGGVDFFFFGLCLGKKWVVRC